MHGSCAQALKAALDLARSGLAVFPCGYSKRPTCEHGLLDATTDATVLRELWRRHGGELVAVRTGATSGIDVLDLDKKHHEAVEWWRTQRDQLPTTRAHRTRRGGLHLILQHAAGLCCSTSKLARGVDVKADGGCAIWWPAAGLPVLCDAEPAPWLDRLLAQLKPPASPPQPGRCVVPDSRRLQQLFRRVSTARQGERNALAFWGACRLAEMVGTGLLGEGEATALVVEAAMVAGLPRTEAIAAARSGLRRAGRS
jgi:hypothetical protein